MKPAFWQKLDTLLKHRLPLLNCLELLWKESADAQERRAVEGVLAKLKAGEPLSATVEEPATRGILAGGERAGELPAAVERVARRMEEKERLRAQLFAASLYPLLVLVLCAGLCVVLTAVVLPRFEKLFASMGITRLPALTAALMGFGAWLRAWGGGALGALAVALGLLWARLGAQKRTGLLWRLPLAGKFLRKAALENFFSTLGILLKSGVPTDEALRLTAEALRGTPLQEAIVRAAGRVKEGDRLSAVLRESGFFEESQLELLALSEMGGGVGESCVRLGELAREDLQLQLKTAMTLLEPALIVGMAGLVALMVVALFLPLGPLVAKLAEGG